VPFEGIDITAIEPHVDVSIEGILPKGESITLQVFSGSQASSVPVKERQGFQLSAVLYKDAKCVRLEVCDRVLAKIIQM
jgi:hypothetical protein